MLAEVLHHDIATHTEPDCYELAVWIFLHHVVDHHSILLGTSWTNTQRSVMG